MKKSFTIDSPARLHLGFMELNDTNSRVFGSVGLAITNFKFKQSIQINKDFDVICESKINNHETSIYCFSLFD